MSEQLGVALLGAGGIGRLRAAAVARSPHTRLVVVADPRLDAAREVAARWEAKASDDPAAAVADPEVELVIVSTPPDRHLEVAEPAFAAGRHVLCEKPLAHTLDDARALCEGAERAGVLLKTGFNHRYFEAMQFARRLLDRGTIGEVLSVRAYAGHPGGVEFGHDWIHDPAVTGGGCLVDNGIHILDLTRWFFGEVVAARGNVANLVWPFAGAEDNAFALFRSASGGVAAVRASWTEWRGYRFWVEVVASRGFVKASYPPMWVEWGRAEAPGHRARRRIVPFVAFQLGERLRGWQWTIVRSFERELADLATGIRAGRPVAPTGRDGLRTLEMAHAVYRSSREGREISL